MGRRRLSRRANGRFRRATLENTFGLRAPVCSKCCGFNPHKVGEPSPTVCCQCGEPFVELVAGVDVNEVRGG